MINTNLLVERKKRGLTTQQVADTLGVHQNTYINWEQGNTTPSGDNLINLTHFFKATPEYLLGKTRARDRSISSTSIPTGR